MNTKTTYTVIGLVILIGGVYWFKTHAAVESVDNSVDSPSPGPATLPDESKDVDWIVIPGGRLQLTPTGPKGNHTPMTPPKNNGVLSHDAFSLRFDAPTAPLAAYLRTVSGDVQTFTEATRFEKVLKAGTKYRTVMGGRDGAVRYNPVKVQLVSAETVVLVPFPYGAGLQIKNVSALVCFFDTCTVATLHAPAHTGHGTKWDEHDPQSASSSKAYRALLEALPGFCAGLAARGRPVVLSADWNKPLGPGYWRNRLMSATGFHVGYGQGIVGDFVLNTGQAMGHPGVPVPGFDHIPYHVTYRTKRGW